MTMTPPPDPAVSVVIPTFGRPDLLLRAIRSVQAQTHGDFELIVVIDGDDPATMTALADVQDPRLRTIVPQEKCGAGGARNLGAAQARGRWVAFLDDDDEWMPEKLAKVLAAAPHDRCILTSLIRVVARHGERVNPTTPYDGRQPIDEWMFDRHSWMRGSEAMIQTSALVFPRALFGELQFVEPHEEWQLCFRAVKQHGYEYVTVREPLVVYYVPVAIASLSNSYRLTRTLGWLDANRALLTRRAYSGFALTVASQVKPEGSRNRAMMRLLRAAFAHGAPTAKQLFAFAFIWAVPQERRVRLRALFGRNSYAGADQSE